MGVLCVESIFKKKIEEVFHLIVGETITAQAEWGGGEFRCITGEMFTVCSCDAAVGVCVCV